MARLKEIVIDAVDAPRLARFWAAALGEYAVRAYDDAEIARLAALGFTPETDPVVMLDGPGPSLCFQTVPQPRPRAGCHLDILGGPRADEIARLETLGAIVEEHRDGYTVMLDPEGGRFCVQDP